MMFKMVAWAQLIDPQYRQLFSLPLDQSEQNFILFLNPQWSSKLQVVEIKSFFVFVEDGMLLSVYDIIFEYNYQNDHLRIKSMKP